MVEEIHLEGWKGKDNITILDENDFYVIIEHRKEKSSGEIATNKHKILKSDVTFLFNLIKQNFILGQKITYRELVTKLIADKNLYVDVDSFNGGRNRKRYFKIYYYPLKVIESKGFISYSGRGVIVRLI